MNNKWQRIYHYRQLPHAEKARKIAMLIQLGKIPYIGRQFLNQIPKYFINGKNVIVIRGFYCIYGNIDAENVDLCDAFCIDYGLIKIGKNTSFSFQVMILTSNHDLEDFCKVIVEPVIIGENVRIESRVIILKGVTIGDNTVIGAGSVVAEDIPSGVLAAGVPCKVIRQIDRGKIEWWENDKENLDKLGQSI